MTAMLFVAFLINDNYMYSDVIALFVYCHWECVIRQRRYFSIWICFVLGRYYVV